MLTLWFVVVIVLFVFISKTVRIVQQYEKGLVETLGKYSRTVGAGVTVVIPLFQSLKKNRYERTGYGCCSSKCYY